MASEIVPFGKYRGQPVELLAADRESAQRELAEAEARVARSIPQWSKQRDQQELERCQHQAAKLAAGWQVKWQPLRVIRREFEVNGWDAVVHIQGGYDAHDSTGYAIKHEVAECSLYIDMQAIDRGRLSVHPATDKIIRNTASRVRLCGRRDGQPKCLRAVIWRHSCKRCGSGNDKSVFCC